MFDLNFWLKRSSIVNGNDENGIYMNEQAVSHQLAAAASIIMLIHFEDSSFFSFF